MTPGFNHVMNINEGALWPVSYTLTELTAAKETEIGELVKEAIS